MKSFGSVWKVAVLMAFSGMAGTAIGTATGTGQGNSPADILSEVHAINQMEIHMGKMAEARGATAGVRHYGKRLVHDHRAADEKLTKLVRRERITLTPPPADLAQSQKADMDTLAALHGSAFDARFLPMMVQGHAKAIQDVGAAEAGLRGQPSGKYLASILPTLKEHQRIAEDLVQKEKRLGR